VLTATEKPSERLTLTAALGTITALAWQTAVGGVRATQTLGDLSVTLNAAREMVGGTAEAIRERVMRDDFGLYLYNDFTDHILGEANFHHYMYSDGNARTGRCFLRNTKSCSGDHNSPWAMPLPSGLSQKLSTAATTITGVPCRMISPLPGSSTAETTTAISRHRGAAYWSQAPPPDKAQPGAEWANLRLRDWDWFTKSSRMETYWSNELSRLSSTGFGFRLWYDF
jgi:hypothetical protein